MPQNLEIKARIKSISKAYEVANSFDTQFVDELHQCDTYFVVPKGRLKLREINSMHAELIFYLRDESLNLRNSNYQIYSVSEPAKLRSFLEVVFGVKGIVRKRRSVYLFDSSRIHIDIVEDLGPFIEFEVPIKRDINDAKKKMKYLIDRFAVQESDLIKGSYADLIENVKCMS